MTQLNAAQIPVGDALGQFKSRVEHYLSTRLDKLAVNQPDLLDAMRYGLLQGGKRVRPFLVYATGQLVETDLNDLDAPAAAIECIHSYSLIHDDLPAMDDDDLRRGNPTVHRKFDEATAILAGDSLQSLAFSILADHNYRQTADVDVLAMIRLLSDNSGYPGMCGGQALDLANTDTQVDVAALEKMHRLKTGALIEAAVLMGSHCSRRFSNEQRRLLSDYAQAIGLAFQVQDDILDVVGDTAVIGKPKGSDIEANKSTYVSLLGLENARQKADSLYKQSLEALDQLPYNTGLLEAFASFVVHRDH